MILDHEELCSLANGMTTGPHGRPLKKTTMAEIRAQVESMTMAQLSEAERQERLQRLEKWARDNPSPPPKPPEPFDDKFQERLAATFLSDVEFWGPVLQRVMGGQAA